MPHLQMVQIIQGAVSVGAALPLAPWVGGLFLSGLRSGESTTPLGVGVPTAVSHFRAPCFLGFAEVVLKDSVVRSHF